MHVSISPTKASTEFVSKVEKLADQNLLACYQCGNCSAGCPMGPHMDILPNQIIRLSQLGMQDQLLNSKAIWLCVSCLTCDSRCPKGVNIAGTIEALRQINLRQRKDHLVVQELPNPGENLPPIALISAMRKFTS